MGMNIVNKISAGKFAGGTVEENAVVYKGTRYPINNQSVIRIEVIDKNSEASPTLMRALTGIGSTVVSNTYMINIFWSDGQVSNVTVNDNVFAGINCAAVSQATSAPKKVKGPISCSGMLGAFLFIIIVIFALIFFNK